jgi:hypothetical protein
LSINTSIDDLSETMRLSSFDVISFSDVNDGAEIISAALVIYSGLGESNGFLFLIALLRLSETETKMIEEKPSKKR